jgi:selenocysteine-specific elongation factor
MDSIVVGTAGHIDHGKSALVQALTGTDPDRLKEEKARGITIDLGFAHAEIGGRPFAFVDVPGHERFVKNMLAGAGGIDLVVLVVAADESVMPQTREHFDICRLLHVATGVVALTKADLADADMLEIARLDVRDLVAGSFLDRAPIVPVSVRDGRGLDELRAALLQAATGVAPRPIDGPARLPIDRVFSMKGFGTVVTGTLVSGRIAVDSDLILMPGGRPVKVRGVQVHGERRQEAAAGQRTAINLGGVEVTDISRGQELVTPGAFAESRVVDATVDVLSAARALKHGARVRFHQGTSEIIGRIAIVDPAATVIASGGSGFVRLRLEAPAVLARGDRYILRAYSPPATIAGGAVLDPVPPRSRIRSAAASARLRGLAIDRSSSLVDSQRRAAAILIADAGQAAMPTAALVWRVGVNPGQVDALVAALSHESAAVAAGDVLVAPAEIDRLAEAILRTLADHHRLQPLSEGIPREELRAQLFRRGHPAVFDRAIERLAQAGKIALRDRVALAGHRLELSPEEATVRDSIERTYRDAGLTPPDPSTIAAAIGVGVPVADRIVKLLQRQKVLVKVDVLLFHEAALKGLKADIAALKTAAPPARIDVATFKQRYGVSRKFAIPLLEYLDRERVTRRAGDVRVVL